MTSYEITSDDLVQLIALSCAHALKQDEEASGLYSQPDERADAILESANAILKRTGVRYPSKFWERCGRALEAELHRSEPNPEDPYLWESGT